MLIILKILFLFLAVFYGFSNIGRIHYKQSVESMNIALMAIGIVGFIVLQFNLYQ
jgi:hypothetical protein